MSNKPLTILAIESSCDEAGVTILQVEKDGNFKILANLLHSQIDIHKVTKGVVPEVAARQHVLTLPPLLEQAFSQANLSYNDIDLYAVTYGPGLNGSLLIGIEAAKTLSYISGKPLIGVNHLQAHLHANLFDLDTLQIKEMEYPTLGLLVSGGHTELILMKDAVTFEKVGQTLDDAVGESFDKVASVLGLEYPGGPQIAKQAAKGDENAYDLPIAMKGSDKLDFSYSGLKTAVRQLVEKEGVSEEVVQNVSASFQKAAIGQLIDRTKKAIKKHTPKALIVAGGVSANTYLREQLDKEFSDRVDVQIPPFNLCTDNALMIAMSAYIQFRYNPKNIEKFNWKTITSSPALDIEK